MSTLELIGISKSFAGVSALTDVSLSLRSGTVHGLLGENGAGKSTLMQVLFGLVSPDAGTIRSDGREIRIASPRDARSHGIGMVQQHATHAPSLTALEHLALAVSTGLGPIAFRALRERGQSFCATLGWTMPWDAKTADLSVGDRQRLDIVCALAGAGRVLVLDEPTAVLAPQEAAELLSALRRLAASGTAIVLITHKLGEIEAACDEVTVLRRGRRVHYGPLAGLGRERLAELMVGRAPAAVVMNPQPAPSDASTPLRFTHVHANASGRRLTDVTFTVHAGEIVGVAGVDGNGQDLLVDAAIGLIAPSAGRVERVAQLGERTLAVIPSDRRGEGLVTELSVMDNLLLKQRGNPPYAFAGWLATSVWQRSADKLVRRFAVRPPTRDLPAGSLSGGNQQKAIIARELGGRPRLIVATNPTRGLDLAATAFVMARLIAARHAGAAVLLVHSDLDELLTVADRVLVCCAGRVIDSGWPRCDREHIGRLMVGGRLEAHRGGEHA
ncbi:MAG: ABC transporter ATP-binding protein [Planctomycetota bacterium]